VDETELNLNEQQRVRRQKLAELRDLGSEPYPLRLPRPRTHTAAEAIAAFARGALAEGQAVTLVGRMMTVRVMGKAAFAHIEDGSG
jgi:lysyl-tRNA synthetase class 2